MRCFSLAASLLSLLHTRLAVAEQITTVTVVQNPDFTTTIAQLVATDPPSQPSTLQTSNLQASSSRAGYGGYASSAPNTVNGIDVEGGAAGTNNSFSLSTGGLIAIIVIVILVVIFGSKSTSAIAAEHEQVLIKGSRIRHSICDCQTAAMEYAHYTETRIEASHWQEEPSSTAQRCRQTQEIWSDCWVEESWNYSCVSAWA